MIPTEHYGEFQQVGARAHLNIRPCVARTSKPTAMSARLPARASRSRPLAPVVRVDDFLTIFYLLIEDCSFGQSSAMPSFLVFAAVL